MIDSDLLRDRKLFFYHDDEDGGKNTYTTYAEFGHTLLSLLHRHTHTRPSPIHPRATLSISDHHTKGMTTWRHLTLGLSPWQLLW